VKTSQTILKHSVHRANMVNGLWNWVCVTKIHNRFPTIGFVLPSVMFLLGLRTCDAKYSQLVTHIVFSKGLQEVNVGYLMGTCSDFSSPVPTWGSAG
jgi:hypothetical protein